LLAEAAGPIWSGSAVLERRIGGAAGYMEARDWKLSAKTNVPLWLSLSS
jgi:hypothetical protein